VLLDAFASVARARPQARLWIAGDGPRRAMLEARRDALGLGDRVRFLGTRPDVPDLLAAADVVVLSSVREGLPVTLLEAMRAERPVVATAVGGCSELVVDGETGRLVPPEDPAALGAAVAPLLADRGLAGAMGAAGRRRWSERYTAEAMVRGTEAVYREVLGARAPSLEGDKEGADGERHVASS
jgi:glycosyltransferase involved in cell wall biosynthesis